MNVDEQIEFIYSFDFDELEHRCRDISTYDTLLRLKRVANAKFMLPGAPKSEGFGIKRLLAYMMHRDGHIDWVDLGGGNAVALREGNIYVQHVLYPALPIRSKLMRTTNVDLFDMDEQILAEVYSEIADENGVDIADKRFRPRFLRGDIRSAEYGSAPNIVTCTMAIQYCFDPLLAIWNAINQAQEGCFLAISNLNFIRFNDKGLDTMISKGLFKECLTFLAKDASNLAAMVSGKPSRYRFGFDEPLREPYKEGYRYFYR